VEHRDASLTESTRQVGVSFLLLALLETVILIILNPDRSSDRVPLNGGGALPWALDARQWALDLRCKSSTAIE
jgi:hypothetical protein